MQNLVQHKVDTNNQIRYFFSYQHAAMEIKKINRKIETVEEYRQWVKDWREFHAAIVNGIHFFRSLKDRLKYEEGFDNKIANSINSVWLEKKYMGTIARRLYQMREENKALLKSGALTKLETV